MHEDQRSCVAPDDHLTEGTFVTGMVICHHPFGIGVRLDESGQYGHVDVPFIRNKVTRGPDDYPAIGQAISAVVLGYDGFGQLRLTTRLQDLPGHH